MKYRFFIIALCVLLFPALAFAGHSAFDNMVELDEELGGLSGQVGIAIDGSIKLVDGYTAWIDQDGLNGDASNNGVLLFDDLRLNGGGGNGPLMIQELTIDADTNAAGKTVLIINLPKISGEFTVGNISIGKDIEDARENSLGSISIRDVDLSKDTILLSPH
ncbi:conserved hypothetical protein [Desulfatibacillum aliphaticivorans]|uniref:Uncharacterized protein n=1 Tax=Desulfatibacillum aliphaticivorans TaxID=218208 RepID=B8FF50_DESAL|nr:hypothetical protein [Desulfatibacillum aliphaticivorans]ACL03867.1 conserved hypothetical protein [Desulfatibacillum aliphaticivorans]